MADTNTVTFGLENVHFCTYSFDSYGDVVLGTPVHQPGAVSLEVSPSEEDYNFYADNIAYFSQFIDNGFEGSLEVAKFDDTFKTNFLGYVALDNSTGGIAQVKGAIRPKVAIIWEFKGDAQKRRCIAYNVALGAIQRTYSTLEDSVEVATETINVNCTGDNATGIVISTFTEDDAAYSTMFTAPPVPDLPSA